MTTKRAGLIRLKDAMGNKKTLDVRYKQEDGEAFYQLYGSHGPTGKPFAISNMFPLGRSNTLPAKKRENEDDFVTKAVTAIKENSTCRVIDTELLEEES